MPEIGTLHFWWELPLYVVLLYVFIRVVRKRAR